MAESCKCKGGASNHDEHGSWLEKFRQRAADMAKLVKAEANDEIKFRNLDPNYVKRVRITTDDFISGSTAGTAVGASSSHSLFPFATMTMVIRKLADPKTWAVFCDNYNKLGLLTAAAAVTKDIAQSAGLGFCSDALRVGITELTNNYIVDGVKTAFEKVFVGFGISSVVTIVGLVLRSLYMRLRARSGSDDHRAIRRAMQERDWNGVSFWQLFAQIAVGSVGSLIGNGVVAAVLVAIITTLLISAAKQFAPRFWTRLKSWWRGDPRQFEWVVPFALDNTIPIELLCPINHTLLVQPVKTPAGHVYEMADILQWLDTNNSDPLTRSPLDATQLSPCPELQELVWEFARHHNLRLVQV